MKIVNTFGETLFEGTEGQSLGRTLLKAVEQGQDLRHACLKGAYLRSSDLRAASLPEACLAHVDLARADLTGADLTGADLRFARLTFANLTNANLTNANLTNANLACTHLQGARLPHYQICPEVGAFRAWKGLRLDGFKVLAEIGIPRDAERTSSLVGRKCRASKAKVLRLIRLEHVSFGSWVEKAEITSAFSIHECGFRYTVGQYVHPDKYDPDPRVECTNGIHFFMSKREAIEY